MIGRALPDALGALVKIVGTDASEVERALFDGRLECPGCAGVLGPWGWARLRVLRVRGGGVWRQRPRRSRCRGCGKTHVLLGAFGLLRRRDAVWSIGFALVARAAGHGFRWSAARLGVPDSTVRGWLRRFAVHAEAVRVWFTVLAHDLDPLLGRIFPTGSLFGDAVEAVGMAARAAEKRLGSQDGWGFVSRASAGALLSNTGCPWAPAR